MLDFKIALLAFFFSTCFLLSIAPPATADPIRPVAGTGAAGFNGHDQKATEALLALPSGVAVSESGDVFIADASNHIVRKVDSVTGAISTVAGTGKAGLDENTKAKEAQLDSPADVALAANGDLIIADSGNQIIRQIDHVDGSIHTIAGNGDQGWNGHNHDVATEASLDNPSAIACTPEGDVYVADTGNHIVRLVSKRLGFIRTIAGTSKAGFSENKFAPAAQLNSPAGVAVTKNRDVYISDTGNNLIRLVEHKSDSIRTVAGNREAIEVSHHKATKAKLSSPRGLAIGEDGDLFVADTGNKIVRRVNPLMKTINTVAGSAGKSGFSGHNHKRAIEAKFSEVWALAFSKHGLVIADRSNNIVSRVILARPSVKGSGAAANNSAATERLAPPTTPLQETLPLARTSTDRTLKRSVPVIKSILSPNQTQANAYTNKTAAPPQPAKADESLPLPDLDDSPPKRPRFNFNDQYSFPSGSWLYTP